MIIMYIANQLVVRMCVVLKLGALSLSFKSVHLRLCKNVKNASLSVYGSDFFITNLVSFNGSSN